MFITIITNDIYINKLLICGEFVLERIRFHIFYFKKAHHYTKTTSILHILA